MPWPVTTPPKAIDQKVLGVTATFLRVATSHNKVRAKSKSLNFSYLTSFSGWRSKRAAQEAVSPSVHTTCNMGRPVYALAGMDEGQPFSRRFSTMQRYLFLAYGIACYLLFLVTYAWMAGFVGGFLNRSIDGPATAPPMIAAAVNVGLMLLFGLQHSVMARPGFKRVWTRVVPRPIERSTYVLLSCAVTALLLWQWRPMPAVAWHVSSPTGRAMMWALFATGWLMVPVVSLMIHHFDLFGVRQVWLHFQGRRYQALPFRTPYLYGRMRHPLYVGWAMAFWATPTMTAGHLLFAGTLTLYMVAAAIIEEKDLIDVYGRQYEEYRRRVPMFIPRLGRGKTGPAAQPGGMSA